MRKPDWWAINSSLFGAGVILIWFYWMLLLAQRAAWSHQAHYAALAGFR